MRTQDRPLTIYELASGFYRDRWHCEDAGPFRRLGWAKPMVKRLVASGALEVVLLPKDRGDGFIWPNFPHYQIPSR